MLRVSDGIFMEEDNHLITTTTAERFNNAKSSLGYTGVWANFFFQGPCLYKQFDLKLPYDPVIPLLGKHLDKTFTEKINAPLCPMCIAELFTIAKIWEKVH